MGQIAVELLNEPLKKSKNNILTRCENNLKCTWSKLAENMNFIILHGLHSIHFSKNPGHNLASQH